jgi:hypothetical protein
MMDSSKRQDGIGGSRLFFKAEAFLFGGTAGEPYDCCDDTTCDSVGNMNTQIYSYLPLAVLCLIPFVLSGCSGGSGSGTGTDPRIGFTYPDPADYSTFTWEGVPAGTAIGRIDVGAVPFKILTGVIGNENPKAALVFNRLEQARLLAKGSVGSIVPVAFKNTGSAVSSDKCR